MNNNHIKVIFNFFDESIEEYTKEGVWAKKIDNYYQLDNIPFYAYLYSCDDIVEVEEIENELIVKKLIKPSGNSTIRLLFEDKETMFKIKEEIIQLGGESESSINNLLLAVNIPKEKDYLSFKEYFEKGEDKNLFQYEESCISENHQLPKSPKSE
jgi:hypothetical protein